jgi:leader peptidase (prepilin peptidase) / N-methyltransferase
LAVSIVGVGCGVFVSVSVAFAGWAVVLVVASVVDVRERRLPRVLLEPALVTGVAWLVTAGLVHDRWADARSALVGLGLMIVLLGVPHLLATAKLAFGDVRLGVLIGLFVGWLSLAAVPLVLLVGCAGAAVVGLVMIRRWHGQVPLGPFLSLAALALSATLALS